MQSFDQVYELLGVSFDHAHGESFYRDQVDQIYLSLGEHKICREDDGALVVFHPEHKRFSKQPFIIRKSDGASNYATTDLATLSHRVNEWKSDRIIYVTDGRQRDHFEQLFLTAENGSMRKREQFQSSRMSGSEPFSERTTRQSKPGMENRSN